MKSGPTKVLLPFFWDEGYEKNERRGERERGRERWLGQTQTTNDPGDREEKRRDEDQKGRKRKKEKREAQVTGGGKKERKKDFFSLNWRRSLPSSSLSLSLSQLNFLDEDSPTM